MLLIPLTAQGAAPKSFTNKHMGTQVIDQEEEWNDYTT